MYEIHTRVGYVIPGLAMCTGYIHIPGLAIYTSYIQIPGLAMYEIHTCTKVGSVRNTYTYTRVGYVYEIRVHYIYQGWLCKRILHEHVRCEKDVTNRYYALGHTSV